MFDECIRRHAHTRPEWPAILWRGGTVNFAKFETDINRAAHELQELAIFDEESVSVAIDDDRYLEWVLIMALARLGVASAPPTDSDSRYRLTNRPEEAPGPETVPIGDREKGRIINGPERIVQRVVRNQQALGRVFLTSGTTGRPKRVGLTWEAVDAMVAGSVTAYGTTPSPWFVTTGSHTSFAFDLTLAAWNCGHASVIANGPNPAVLSRLKPGLLALVPIHLQSLLFTRPEEPADWPLRVVAAGSTTSATLAAAARTRLTSDLVIHFGSTETGSLAAAPWSTIEGIAGAAGALRPGCAARAIDEQGELLAPGESGRLCFSTPALAIGYLNDPDLSAQVFREGWFHSNDYGHVREDGILVVEGRLDDVMNFGGHKTMPASIEEPALSYPGIRDAAAFAVPAKSGLDKCILAIVTDEQVDEAGLRRALQQQLSQLHKIAFYRCDAIPRNDRGKIDRNLLRQLYSEAPDRNES